MDDASSLASWAALLADRTRAAFCLALMDGRAWTVGELARHAGVAMSTASEHADRLVTGGLLTEHRQGRHRYLALATPEVATLIEAVTAATDQTPSPVRTLAAAHRKRNLAYARTCYDHLAGTVGVALADGMLSTGLLTRENGLSLTPTGRTRLTGLGITLDAPGRRPLLRDCLDWTERRPHLAGITGAALLRHALTESWLIRIGTGRALRLTDQGHIAFTTHFGAPLDRHSHAISSRV
ncbi:ArsR/SmtB family transcription factor [Paractinoplanes atraurantiacus]|uniref:DNA-binding transcriptional regulator, ArsR family n=1 Tax=Paractinoplanes atraurantiacus TaxID=1036182 RepID=A0A285I9Z1_9ACTN|nr:winged helix-turn-helix domain-containing protein [Actinoplanes atraurantiacus]SNY44799.1 DNA-binding transcriptional regulator, ArsR family [Actinoplanes atraurantiacus]